MKPLVYRLLIFFTGHILLNSAQAQNPSATTWAGTITYEEVHALDLNKISININGEVIKPGDPRFPTNIPDTHIFDFKTQIASPYAKEVRDDQTIVIQAGDSQGSALARNLTSKLTRPFTEQVFVDLSGLKKVTVLTVGKDADAKAYQAEIPIQRVSGWQFTDQTKKIAGYTCRKATILNNKETYTLWITNELPFTYCPIHELTPDSGVVLLIEGSKMQFKAKKVDTNRVDPATVMPVTTAQRVTPDQLTDLRQKALIEFQQQLQLNLRN